MRGVWCQALSLSGLPVLGSGGRAPLPPLDWRGRAGVGTQHRPHSMRLCEAALRAVGVAGG